MFFYGIYISAHNTHVHAHTHTPHTHTHTTHIDSSSESSEGVEGGARQLTEAQQLELQHVFASCQFPETSVIQELARRLDVTESLVQVCMCVGVTVCV